MPRPARRTGLWLLTGAVALLAVAFFAVWVATGLGLDAVGGAAARSTGLLILGLVAAGVVIRGRPRAVWIPVSLLATAVLLASLPWLEVLRQQGNQDDLLIALDSLDQRLGDDYALERSRDEPGPGQVLGARRIWTAPPSADPCADLPSLLQDWSRRPTRTPGDPGDGCLLVSAAAGAEIQVKVAERADGWGVVLDAAAG